MDETETLISWPGKTSQVFAGVFLRRLNRFVAEVKTADGIFQAHLPNPGRLVELLYPGQRVYLTPSNGEKPYKLQGALRYGEFVFLDTVKMNRLAEALISNGLVPSLRGFGVAAREVSCGKSRFDLLLEDQGGRGMLLEVKTCTLFNRTAAFFPDALSERGARHLDHLKEIKHIARGVLFLVQSATPKAFLPDWNTDPNFARAFVEARSAGVEMMALKVSLTGDLRLRSRPEEIPIPLDEALPHMVDRGVYALLMQMGDDTVMEVGSLGTVEFRRGHYVYVGSGMGGLSGRIARHMRSRKTLRWHVDHLSSRCTRKRAFPIRTVLPLECHLAEVIGGLGGAPIPRFGSSDCKCGSHLFFFPQDPSRGVFEAVLEIRSKIGLGYPVNP